MVYIDRPAWWTELTLWFWWLARRVTGVHRLLAQLPWLVSTTSFCHFFVFITFIGCLCSSVYNSIINFMRFLCWWGFRCTFLVIVFIQPFPAGCTPLSCWPTPWLWYKIRRLVAVPCNHALARNIVLRFFFSLHYPLEVFFLAFFTMDCDDRSIKWSNENSIWWRRKVLSASNTASLHRHRAKLVMGWGNPWNNNDCLPN